MTARVTKTAKKLLGLSPISSVGSVPLKAINKLHQGRDLAFYGLFLYPEYLEEWTYKGGTQIFVE